MDFQVARAILGAPKVCWDIHNFTLILGDLLIFGEPHTPTLGPWLGTPKLGHHQIDGCFGAVCS